MFQNQIVIYSSESSCSESSEDEQEDGSPKINRFVAYRHHELSLQKIMSRCFEQWKQNTIDKYRQNIFIANQYYEHKLLEKGFDSIMEYAIISSEFHKKIMIICYKIMLRLGFETIRQHQRLQPQQISHDQNSEKQLVFEFEKPENILIYSNEQTPRNKGRNKTKTQLFHAQISAIKQRNVENVQEKQKPILPINKNSDQVDNLKNKTLPAILLQKTSRARSENNTSFLQNRRFKPITEKIELPIFQKPSNINQIKHKEILDESQNKKQLSTRKAPLHLQTQKIPENQEKHNYKQKQIQRNLKNQNKKNSILDILSKQKIIEKEIMSDLLSRQTAIAQSSYKLQIQKYRQFCKKTTNMLLSYSRSGY